MNTYVHAWVPLVHACQQHVHLQDIHMHISKHTCTHACCSAHAKMYCLQFATYTYKSHPCTPHTQSSCNQNVNSPATPEPQLLQNQRAKAIDQLTTLQALQHIQKTHSNEHIQKNTFQKNTYPKTHFKKTIPKQHRSKRTHPK